MRRVVVTGLGVVSSIGNNKQEVSAALRAGKSGIRFCQEYADLGFRSHIHGDIKLNPAELIDRKVMRFLGDGAAFNYLAMHEAITDSGLEQSDISNPRTGIITVADKSVSITQLGQTCTTSAVGDATAVVPVTGLLNRGFDYQANIGKETAGHYDYVVQFGASH